MITVGHYYSIIHTLAYPEQVRSLVLVDAPGLQVKDSTPYESVNVPVDESDLQAYLQSIFYKVPFVPRPFRAYLLAQSSKNFSWLNGLRTKIREGKDYFLDDRIVQVKVPTLVLWGDHDTLVTVGVGDLYSKRIAGSKWVLMENCGHAPQYERPKETAHHLLAFLREVNK